MIWSSVASSSRIAASSEYIYRLLAWPGSRAQTARNWRHLHHWRVSVCLWRLDSIQESLTEPQRGLAGGNDPEVPSDDDVRQLAQVAVPSPYTDASLLPLVRRCKAAARASLRLAHSHTAPPAARAPCAGCSGTRCSSKPPSGTTCPPSLLALRCSASPGGGSRGPPAPLA